MTRRSKIFWIACALAGLHLLVLFAGFIAPYNYETQDRLHPYAPPTHIHFIDQAGTFHLRPFVCSLQDSAPGIYVEDCARVGRIQFFTGGDDYTLFGLIHSSRHLFGVSDGATCFLLGSDAFGRDQFSRLLYGGQISLFAGLVAGCASVVIGMILGGLAGAYGGWVDSLAMRMADLFIVMPWFYVLIAIRAFLPLQMGPLTAFFLVVLVIGVAGWGRPARLVRGVLLSAREQNYVLAARGFGASQFYLLRRHLAPQATSVLLTQMAVLVPQFILAEVVLSFLGLGIGGPFPSWGNMLAGAQQYQVLFSYWWMLLPGIVPIPVFLGYHALSGALQERMKSSH